MWSEWLYHVAQFQLMVLGIVAITVIAQHPKWAVWGFALGLFNQWAWFYTAAHDHAWGVAVVNIAYTVNYIRGIRNYRRAHALLHPPAARAGEGGEARRAQVGAVA